MEIITKPNSKDISLSWYSGDCIPNEAVLFEVDIDEYEQRDLVAAINRMHPEILRDIMCEECPEHLYQEVDESHLK